MSDYRLAGLLDMSQIQRLADSNFQASGLPMSIVDAVDNSLLVQAGWQDICLKFHRVHLLSQKRCNESDASVYDRIAEGEAVQYRCQNGLWHVAMPIMVAGRHLGTMFLSQFFFEGEVPQREFFIKQAREFGYDLEAYLAALDSMPVFSLEKVDYIIAYDKALVRFIADLAEQSLRARKAEECLRRSEEQYRTLVNNVDIGVYRNTSGEGCFIQVNPAIVKIFGYAIEEMLQITITDLFQNPVDRISFIEEVKQLGFVKDRELAMLRKDGTPIWCSVTATAQFDEKGEINWMDGVVEDITARKKAAEGQQRAHGELERRVEQRTAELQQALERLQREIVASKRAEEALQESKEKLSFLASRLLSVQERERKLLAYELHDDLGQSLTVLKLKVRSIASKLSPGTKERREAADVLAYINGIVDKIRCLHQNLCPAMLQDLGLFVALRHLFDEFAGHHQAKVDLDLAQDEIGARFSQEARIFIYRIFQEALNNISKYAQASRISLSVKRQDGRVSFRLEDNGIGFDLPQALSADKKNRGLGLATMEERVRMLGGILNIRSRKGRGTRISFAVPLGQ